ncbi:NACHT, LRR and PYD domains-containing protein 3-like isoform X2 [Rhinatrema bivittatum]|uniref:NACHT, LRR and PYD domains-containing protein 3-like isoform X2 n=1 Tax=Rhinatrema bivittatum TaxID=194408 RepID=UPI00112CDDEB|nr:NACHT, LRR and PYD domains-containing protein 3-like isoform X2 [Rhinatrema bivittatum]
MNSGARMRGHLPSGPPLQDTRSSDAELRQTLASFDDRDLRRITTLYQPRLQQAMNEISCTISAILHQKNLITDKEQQEIKRLDETHQKVAASEHLFKVVLGKQNAKAGRAMWEEIINFQHNLHCQKLKSILGEIHAKGPTLLQEITFKALGTDAVQEDLKEAHKLHKETLRDRNQRLVMNTISGREKVRSVLLADHYTDLVVISSLREMRVVEHELLVRGRDHERWRQQVIRKELETLQHHQIFRSCFGIESKSTSVAISGVAGIGKTTLLQKIVYDWAMGKIYPQFHFIFHFKFRDLNSYGSTNIRTLILDSYPYLSGVLNKILQDPSNLLFIFDGLDEFKASISFTDSLECNPGVSVCPDPVTLCPISDIVRCLVQGKVLKGSSVLITTRPTVLKSLKKSVIHLHAEILGFNAEQRKRYFLNFYDTEAIGEEAFQYVEQNDILYTMCYNPSYCWIICCSLQTTFRDSPGEQQQRPRTITELFSNYIYNILQNHAREDGHSQEVLLRLGDMAYQGVSERVIVFSESHLQEHSLQPSQFLSGFLMEILQTEHSLQREAYSFFHLTVQEFIAALTRFICTPPEQVTQLLDRAGSIKDGKFEIFLRFFAGLSCPWYQKLEPFFGELPHATTCMVIDWVGKRLLRKTRNKRKLLNAFHCLYECQNKGLTQTIISKISNINLSKMSLSPVDCYLLAWALEPCELIGILNLQYCQMTAEGLRRLVPVLHKCTELWLQSVDLGDVGTGILSEALKRSDCRIQKLVIGANKIEDLGVKRMLEALRHPNCKIKNLRLWDNCLTDACAEDLCAALRHNTTLLKLDLSKNAFTAQSVSSFVQLILTSPSLRELQLGRNRLEDSGVRLFSEALGNPTCKLQRLGLRENNLTDCCLQDLSTALSSNQIFRNLDLCKNSFSSQSLPLLTALIRNCSRLRVITLYGNDQLSPQTKDELRALNRELRALRPKLKVEV